MRVPRFRFTIRRLALLIAAVAVLLAAGIEGSRLMRLRNTYRTELAYHVQRQHEEQQVLDVIAATRSKGIPDDPLTPQLERIARVQLAYHADLERKYRRAAARPWETAPCDPMVRDSLIWKMLEVQPIDDDVKFIDPDSIRP
jgi:hypothetical protein